MAECITPGQIRENNRTLIYQLIYNRRRIAQQEIAYELGLSRPTVTARLSELEQEGLICRAGAMESGQAGRKAAAFSVVKDHRVAAGVEIGPHNFALVLLNLYGEVLDQTTVFLEYENHEDYYRRAAQEIQQFIAALYPDPAQVLGVGFSLPAKISADGSKVLYGGQLGNTGLSVEAFSEHLPYACTFVQDADCAAVAEIWNTPELGNAWYLNLSYHLSSALILNGSIYTGRKGYGSSIEHVPMRPEGERCYCGKTGCLETCCSVAALLGKTGETLPVFMNQVRMRDEAHVGRYQEFLRELAHALTILQLGCDTTMLLGGELAEYMTEEDLTYLQQQMEERMPYVEPQDSLQLGKTISNRFALGAALPFIWSFLGQSPQ